MKIAITSTGNNPQSRIDSRFGRCSYIALYNQATGEMEFFEKPGKESPSGAGPSTARLIAETGATRVVAMEFGAKVKPILESLNIEMQQCNEESSTIQDIVAGLN